MSDKYAELAALAHGNAASATSPDSTGGGAASEPTTRFESLSDRLGSPANKLNPKTAAPKRAYFIAAALIVAVILVGWLKLVTAKRQAAKVAAIPSAANETKNLKLDMGAAATVKRKALLDSAARANLIARMVTSGELKMAADSLRNDLLSADRIKELEAYLKTREGKQTIANLDPNGTPAPGAQRAGVSPTPSLPPRLAPAPQTAGVGPSGPSGSTYKPIVDRGRPTLTDDSQASDDGMRRPAGRPDGGRMTGSVDLGTLNDSSLQNDAASARQQAAALAAAKKEQAAAERQARLDSARIAELKELSDTKTTIIAKGERKQGPANGRPAARGNRGDQLAAFRGAAASNSVIKPGTKVMAQLTSPYLSLTADLVGATAKLLAPVRAKDGSVLLPTGTIAFGTAEIRGLTEGVEQPRVVFNFNQYQLPNGDLLEEFQSMSFDLRDGLPGVPGDVNHRMVKRVLTAAVATGLGLVATADQTQQSSALLQPSAKQVARQDLAQRMNGIARQQFGGNENALKSEVKVPVNTVFNLVFNLRGGKAVEATAKEGAATAKRPTASSPFLVDGPPTLPMKAVMPPDTLPRR